MIVWYRICRLMTLCRKNYCSFLPNNLFYWFPQGWFDFVTCCFCCQWIALEYPCFRERLVSLHRFYGSWFADWTIGSAGVSTAILCLAIPIREQLHCNWIGRWISNLHNWMWIEIHIHLFTHSSTSIHVKSNYITGISLVSFPSGEEDFALPHRRRVTLY